MALHGDRKMERAMGAITAEGDDGGETEKNGVRDTNTRDTDTYRSLKIESNYREGAKKMRRGEKERTRREVVMSIDVL